MSINHYAEEINEKGKMMDTSSIYLRALEPEDYKITHQWRVEEGISNALGGTKRLVSVESERKWVLSAIEMHEQTKVLRFVICDKDSSEVLGMMSVTDVDFINSSFALHSILDAKARGKGTIGKARKLVLDYMFLELGMNRAWSQILESNDVSRRAVEKFGFVKDGILRAAVFKQGEYRNLVVYSMLRNEFLSLYHKN